ncbi:hypothetical protein Nmel_015134 [Mimus melanotis]
MVAYWRQAGLRYCCRDSPATGRERGAGAARLSGSACRGDSGAGGTRVWAGGRRLWGRARVSLPVSPRPQLHPVLADLRPGRAGRHEAAVQSGGGEGSGGHGENSETQKGMKCMGVEGIAAGVVRMCAGVCDLIAGEMGNCLISLVRSWSVVNNSKLQSCRQAQDCSVMSSHEL